MLSNVIGVHMFGVLEIKTMFPKPVQNAEVLTGIHREGDLRNESML
jgi:hypothetical protein